MIRGQFSCDSLTPCFDVGSHKPYDVAVFQSGREQRTASTVNPGVYRATVSGQIYEWIPSEDVGLAR